MVKNTTSFIFRKSWISLWPLVVCILRKSVHLQTLSSSGQRRSQLLFHLRSLRGRDRWLTRDPAPPAVEAPYPPPVLGTCRLLPTIPTVGVTSKDGALREPCVVGTIWMYPWLNPLRPPYKLGRFRWPVRRSTCLPEPEAKLTRKFPRLFNLPPTDPEGPASPQSLCPPSAGTSFRFHPRESPHVANQHFRGVVRVMESRWHRVWP